MKLTLIHQEKGNNFSLIEKITCLKSRWLFFILYRNYTCTYLACVGSSVSISHR